MEAADCKTNFSPKSVGFRCRGGIECLKLRSPSAGGQGKGNQGSWHVRRLKVTVGLLSRKAASVKEVSLWFIHHGETLTFRFITSHLLLEVFLLWKAGQLTSFDFANYRCDL